MYSRFILTLIATIFMATTSYAKAIDVSSDKLDVEVKTGIAVFSGNVKTVYEDITLESNSLEVKYDPKNTNSDDSVESIKAFGDVYLTQGSDHVTSDYAEFYPDKDIIIFKDNVTLNRNGNTLKGDFLTINIVTKKAEMRPKEGGQVKAIYLNKPTQN